ncbi:hypothetical protein LCGC14_2900050 [marine sediment metagenome]|uniref:Phage protein n=1 Tax=marine sediment metagenome TaxID=412755 RepID=A0A0F9A2H3_9ZZZZ
MNGNITITKDEYFRLRKAALKLNLLEIGGVDNWEWYGESLNPDGEKCIDDKEEDLKKEIVSEGGEND